MKSISDRWSPRKMFPIGKGYGEHWRRCNRTAMCTSDSDAACIGRPTGRPAIGRPHFRHSTATSVDRIRSSMSMAAREHSRCQRPGGPGDFYATSFIPIYRVLLRAYVCMV